MINIVNKYSLILYSSLIWSSIYCMETDIAKVHTNKMEQAINWLQTQTNSYSVTNDLHHFIVPVVQENIAKKLTNGSLHYKIKPEEKSLVMQLFQIKDTKPFKVCYVESRIHPEHEEDTLYVSYVETDEGYLRQGFANYIMQECIDMSKNSGYKKIYLKSRLYCKPLYEKLGFQQDPSYKRISFLPPYYGFGPKPIDTPRENETVPMFLTIKNDK